MNYDYDAELQRLEGKIAWTVAYVPYPVSDDYGTSGRVNVVATLDGHPFRVVLLPSRNGHYLAFNQEMKAATGKALGDTVHVAIAPDTAPRPVEVPEEIASALAANGSARSVFDALPAYIQRGEIQRVTSAKAEATRQRRLEALVEKLTKGGPR